MDEFNKIFKRFYNRLALEGILRSLILGVLIGSILAVIASIALYISGLNAVWVIPTTFGLGLLLATLLFYFLKYRPTERDVARRVDLEGLKERLITMVENKDSTSFMAKAQRADALKELKKVQEIKLRIKLNFKLLTSSALTFIGAIGVSTLAILSLIGFFPSFDEIIDSGGKLEFEAVYNEEPGGFIYGEAHQLITAGGEAAEVVAVADDGYMFYMWSDGVTTPNRIDKDIKENIEVIARFTEIDNKDSLTNKKDDDAPDTSVDMGDIDSALPPHGNGASGKYEEYNQVIDGETYYRDVLKEYYDLAIEIMNNGGVVPDYIREIVEEYYGVIK